MAGVPGTVASSLGLGWGAIWNLDGDLDEKQSSDYLER